MGGDGPVRSGAAIRLRRVAFAAIGLTFALAAIGWTYEAVSWHLDARRSPQPGLALMVQGRRMQIHCTGRGSPVVILESGLGDTLDQWRRVQPAVSDFARVCSYDRAGYGGSDAGEMPRTSERIAGELHALLQAAGERPPYILVGSSAGGYHVRVFHGRYPAEVAAMVLVDATQEDQYDLLPPSWQAVNASMRERYESQARWAVLQVNFGFLRWRLARQGIYPPHSFLQAKYFRTRWSELEQMRVNAEQARAAGPLGGKPLAVLTGARHAPDPAWVGQIQPRLAKLSTRSRWTVLEDSGHDIPADRPDAIVEAVRELVAGAR